MPKSQKLQTNWNAGILSPYIEGRPDVAQFYNGMLTGRNIALLPEGGFQKMWGSQFFTTTKNNGQAILIAFQPTDEVSFELEFGAGYIRFHKNGAVVFSVGANQISNGDFTTDLTGWTDIDQNGGISLRGTLDGEPCLVLANAGVGVAGRTQAVTTTPGSSYDLTFKVLAGQVQVNVGTSAGNDEISGAIYSPGSHTVRFIAGTATTHISAKAENLSIDATASYIDAFTLGELSAAPYEISSPYTLADLEEIKGGQGMRQINDVLFICCSRLQPKELVYAGDTNWALRNSPFDPMPSAAVRTQIHATATLTPAATTGTGVNFHASTSAFLAGDVNRVILSGAGRALIKTVTDADDVDADILADFAGTSAIPAGQWFLEGTPGVALVFNEWGPVGKTMQVNVVSSTAAFRAGADEGKFIRMYGGIVEITQVQSTSVIIVRILSELTVIKDQQNSGAITPPHTAPIGSWTLESVAWSDILGWPTINEFFQGRYVLDSNNNQRTTKWFSQTNDFYNFALGALATDAIQYTHRSGKFGVTKWLIENGEGLFYGDSWSENSLKGRGVGEPIGGDEIPVAKSEARNGAALMRPIHIGNSLLYLDWTQRRVMAISYNFDRDAFLPKNTMFATRELPINTAPGFTRGMDRHAPAYMADPIPLDFWRRNDGVLLVHSYNDDPEGSNNGWTTLELDGEIESYCVTRVDRTNVLTMIVKRTINGVPVRYIEKIRDNVFDLSEVAWTELQTQCATVLTKSNTLPQTIFAGLGHLEGETVDVLLWATGLSDWQVPRYMGQFTVTGGQIVLGDEIDFPCRLEVGIPFRPLVKTMRASIPESGMDGHLRRWGKYFLRLFKSSLPVVNGTDMQALRSLDTIGQGPYLRSGDYFVSPDDVPANDGSRPWDFSLDAYVEITQTKPYPLRILMAGGELEVSESMGEALGNEGTIHVP